MKFILKIIAKATERRHDKRYSSIDDFINDYNQVKDSVLKKFNEDEFKQRLKTNTLNPIDIQYILAMAEKDEMSRYLIANNINNFSAVIIALPISEEEKILTSIKNSYRSATEYNRFEQYDIFAKIAYDIIINSNNINIKQIAFAILEGCAEYRFYAQHLKEDVERNYSF